MNENYNENITNKLIFQMALVDIDLRLLFICWRDDFCQHGFQGEIKPNTPTWKEIRRIRLRNYILEHFNTALPLTCGGVD